MSDWEQVLGRCAGEEGDLLFECESVHLSKEEEISFGSLFKNCKSSKNGYRTRDHVDHKLRNVEEALLQILQPHRTTYMTSWQVEFVELALADPDEVPASTPPAQLRAEEEPRGARTPQKRKWEGDVEPSRHKLLVVPVRRRANNKQGRSKQKARKLILLANSSVDTERAAVARDSPSFGDDVSAEILGRTDLPALKARVASEEALRPSGHKGRRAATARTPTQERCLPSEQVPFDDSPSAQAPLALKPLEHISTGEGRNAETRVTLAEAPSAVPGRDDVVGPPGAGFPTLLKVLAGHVVEAAAEEAAKPVRENRQGFMQ
ncbi:hypothetical protein AXG93_810s1030 [Marchantia polymorpha subsp. ruderalis]|uniref:Uncharacterized protein n=1 Tax=Marchantia polymorpha subsp. ruderalis TaxID=1480154 RepID=A0A176WBK1_MARPO|nr:hypothetical protein AXG93_810s1030 [Marchantia polymorpha subsp. ruderalis]